MKCIQYLQIILVASFISFSTVAISDEAPANPGCAAQKDCPEGEACVQSDSGSGCFCSNDSENPPCEAD